MRKNEEARENLLEGTNLDMVKHLMVLVGSI